MTAATSRLRRRGIGAGVAALVGLTTVGFSATSASAAPNFEITRPAQVADRFETAASVALAAFPNGAENVIVANGDNAVDALAASVLAGTDIPILYVTSNEVPAATVAALEQLDPSTSWIVGGSAAVSAAVEGELPGTIERIDGATRYETAAALAQTVVDNADTAPTSVFLARGDDFADALAIAPYAAKSGTPVLLTETGALSEAAAAFLAENEITEVTVLGGTAAVSEAVVEELEANDVTVERIRGANRQATAVDIANTEAFGFSNTGVALVNGWRPVDALPASVWAAQQNFPIILTAGDVLGTEAQGYLTANQETLVTGLAIGGTGAIPASVVEAAEQAAGAVEPAPTNQDFTITANDDAVVGEGSEVSYTVAGLPAGDVTIALASADAVANANGVVSFEDTDGIADLGTVGARVLSVNDTVVSSPSAVVTTEVEAGSITFTIGGRSATEEAIVPVVFVDAEEDGLDVGDDGAPVDAFGVGPVTTFATVAGLVADPEEALRQYGTTYQQSVQLVTDTRNDDGDLETAPYAGETVVFQVSRGNTVVSTQTATTDANGVASFSYTLADPSTNTGDTTQDTIVAWLDADGDRINDDVAAEPQVTSTVNWTDAAAATSVLTLDTASEYAEVGSATSVTAEVTDQFGNPLAGEEVVFTIARPGNPNGTFTRTSNAEGIATLNYTGPATPAVDTVTAGVNTDSDADLDVNQVAPAQVTWYAEAEESAEPQAGPVVEADTDANVAYVTVNGATLQFNYGDGPLYSLGGDPVTLAGFEDALTVALDDPTRVASLSVDDYLVEDAATTFALTVSAAPVTPTPPAPAAASITTVNPATGAAAGGDVVTITGTGFANATAVNFGTTPGTAFDVVSDTEITVTTPEGTGTVNVTVVDPDGNDTETGGFVYEAAAPAPAAASITTVNPATGAAAGGDVVTITGTGFANATAVNFGTTPGTAFDVVSDTEITVTTPEGTGTVNVTVVDPDGNDTETGGFIYV
ncbi:cell wall-binding repeat-containing protein [Kineococcus auxinigenes]|uniref:cell wall-binding repeat-containing protein n=1 Tax=unclassified Kineococcus TaxID=2621656 RepID=UPI003D7D7ACE